MNRTLRGAAAIVGIGEFKPVRFTEGATTLGMLATVGMMAVEDAGIDMDEVDGLVTELFSEAPFMGASVMSQYLNMRPGFLEQVDLGGATSGVMVSRAAAAIATGMCDNVLVVTAARRERHVVSAAGPPRGRDRTPKGEFDVPYGTSGPWAFAMFGGEYMRRSRVEPNHLAKIVIAARDNASRNPNAIHFGEPLSEDEYFKSPLTAGPFRAIDAAVSCGGGSALLVTSAERARKFKRPPVFILGAGECHTHDSPAFAESYDGSGLRVAAPKAFAMSGLRQTDMDFACIYDAFSVIIPSALEDAGFIPVGSGGEFIDSSDLSHQSSFPINPHGGQLGFGHTGVPAGMSLITAAARQIMGRAGEHQVARYDKAFVSGIGGEMATNVALVLGSDAQ